jgi:ubiquinone/menaquinone biosynthesis C-methylase UbiE
MTGDEIKSYWDQRASENAGNPSATTDDVWLRELEITVLADTLRELGLADAQTLDLGCGDGYSTLKLAQAVPTLTLLGLDYSANMIDNARRRLAESPALAPRVSFGIADALRLDEAIPNKTFDLVITDRCLINLATFAAQESALGQIAAHLRPGGCYLAIENFLEGQENLTAARRHMGLTEIPVRWHNVFFREREFLAGAKQFFDIVEIKDFSSSYYFATRILYSAMCNKRGEKPDYRHAIHEVAVGLPWIGQFSPIRLAVLRRR